MSENGSNRQISVGVVGAGFGGVGMGISLRLDPADYRAAVSA